jgi:hypothetical protein
MARRLRRLTVLGLACALLVPMAAPVGAQEVSVSSEQRVLGELREARLTISLSGGARARGHVLSFPLDDPSLQLRPHLATNGAAGIEPMRPLARRQLDRGAVAGTNGGYWVNRPTGVPNGLHVRGRRLVSGQAATRSGHSVSRAALGLAADRTPVMDRVDVSLTLTRPDGTTHRIDEINRRLRTSGRFPRALDGELVVFTPRYGAPVDVPPGALAVATDDLAIGSSGEVSGQVRAVHEGRQRLSVPKGQSLLVAFGSRRGTLQGLTTGDQLAVAARVSPAGTDPSGWQRLDHAVAAGPLLLRDGRSPSDEQMIAEAFGRSHVTARHPRTAVARTGDGRMLLVTIDGRRKGWSQGVTLRELVGVLRQLGAVDAVNLDGGGSTTTVINGQIVNRPSESGRHVADGLFVHAPQPPAARDIAQHACPPDRAPSGQFRDSGGSVHSAAIDCLSWWGVTQGVGDGRYAPRQVVTRDQMASFIARWIDSASQRGTSARPLPPAGRHHFSDVSPDSVHADAINRLAEVGIVEGRSSDRYAPREPVTRGQMASLVQRAHEWTSGQRLSGFRDTFVDDNGSVHEPAIDRLAGIRVVTGTGGFSYEPGSRVRRDAMASFLMRGADHLVERGVTRPPPTSEPADPEEPGDPVDDLLRDLRDLLDR